jgi:hypothetical protein
MQVDRGKRPFEPRSQREAVGLGSANTSFAEDGFVYGDGHLVYRDSTIPLSTVQAVQPAPEQGSCGRLIRVSS